MKIILKALFIILFCLFLSVNFPAQNKTETKDINEIKASTLVTEFQNGLQNAASFYNAACYFALAGKTDEAFNYLDKAINYGYSDIEHIKTDSDLTSLHADAAHWQKLLSKAAAKYNEQQAAFYNQKDFWDNPALKTPYQGNLSDEEKIAGLSKFWSEVKYNFVNFDLIPDVNWDAVYLSYIPKVRQTKSTLEYYKVLMELCSRLRDGHTNVYPPKELADEVNARPLINTRLIEDKVIILRVTDDELIKNGIEAGQEITEINGVPVKIYAEENVKPYQSVSTAQDMENRIFSYALLAGSSKSPIALTLRDAKENVFKKSVSRLTAEERIKKNPASVSPFEFKMLSNNIAYVALNSFGDDKAADMFAANYDEIAKADAIIFDVRENGGGNGSVGFKILSYLTDKPFTTSVWYTRQYRPSIRAWGMPQDTFGEEPLWKPNGKEVYRKPVIVLTSPRTFSAAEDFTLAFSILKRGTIIGEVTGGSSGQPLFFGLPGGGSARVCTMHEKDPNGPEFIGKGIVPDKIAKPTVADFRAGRDAVLEAALEQLNTR